MNILIYGGKGWLGSMFSDFLKSQSIQFVSSRVRIDNIKELYTEFDSINPTHIISFIGRTHGEGSNTIDYLEQPGKLKDNIQDNLFCPISLATLCVLKNVHYTYIGTGCIFDSDNTSEYAFKESDTPNFFGSSYSIVKGFTDRLLHTDIFAENVLNIRIRMPIVDYEHDRNFITKIVNYEKICSIPNSMTVIPDMIPLIYDMMKSRRAGTINLVNPGLISHNEILELYNKLVDKNHTWINFSKDEQNSVLKSKRSNNQLDTTLLTSIYPDIPDIKSSIIKCLLKYKRG
jgi:dTDP-4-dehydrorhamnose reductase